MFKNLKKSISSNRSDIKDNYVCIKYIKNDTVLDCRTWNLMQHLQSGVLQPNPDFF
ncbi:hypothetical protein DPMN_075472 [Dreissena polymorpha]|uniref:Uncharacterized protein n=1 Tax=Dreissena polymorpha TaxID=45954 RepID=A0A9D3YKE9_DREPO|nr:hypothetical protein DPMN_075472 [Dreissena polymorpha]